MDRKKEQAELIFMLGQLFGPLLDIAQNPDQYEPWEISKTLAKFFHNRPKFHQAFLDFTTSEPGHNYLIEWGEGANLIGNIENWAARCSNDNKKLLNLFIEKRQLILDIILSIPVSTNSAILDAHTPFSTYCFIKDRCMTVKDRLVWVDRYMDASLFYRFLRDVPIKAKVILITWPSSRMQSNKDKSRFAEFIDISRLFASERGPSFYRLVANEDIHDRWLCCDKQILALGGSIKDAGHNDYLTVSSVEASDKNINKIDELASNGQEIFGPSQTNHL